MGVCVKNLLRRFWPLWAGYLLVLLLILGSIDTGKFAARDLLATGISEGVSLSFLFAVLAVMCMFQFLYSGRGCGMLCSLPLRRETVFITAYLTGLLPLLGMNVLAALLAAPMLLLRHVDLSCLLPWLALMSLNNIAFYGTAVFCAMLTGSLVILPVVYVVLHFAAYVVEACARALMKMFVYGFAEDDWKLLWLSPVLYLERKLNVCVELDEAENFVRAWVTGWGTLAAACAAGLALSVLALLLYRRREMERATDTVALPILKPLFRVCFSIGSGLVFAAVIMEWNYPLDDVRNQALPVGLLLVLGAVIGWFAAEMLLQKTVKVFKRGWKGCFVVCLTLAALTVALEMDLFGIEKRVPSPEQIESVELNHFVDFNFSEPESLEEIVAIHRQLIAEKAANEAGGTHGSSLWLDYRLKNGKTLQRCYTLHYGDEALEDKNSVPMRIQALLNNREALDQRQELGEDEFPLTEDSLVYVRLERDGEYGEVERYNVPQDQALDFVENCLLPDLREGTMDREWYVLPEEYYDLATSWQLRICLERTVPGAGRDVREYAYSLQTDAARCMAWLRENTDLEILPLARETDDRDFSFDYYSTHYYAR